MYARSRSTYQALDHFGPVFSFISRNELVMPASTSIFLAKSQSKSESRLRYARIFGLIASPDSISRTTPRSALRQTVLATSYAAPVGCSPGNDQSESRPGVASI